MGDLLPAAPLPAVIDSVKLARAVESAFDPPEALTAAFVVAWRGRIIAERYANGIDRTTRLPSWSMGKSLTATLIGQLVLEGTYDLWKPAPVAEWQGEADPRRAIRIADLMRMSGGLRFVSSSDPDYDPARGYADHDYIYTGAIDAFRWAVTRPPQWPAGTVGRYRNSDPLVLNYPDQAGRGGARRGLPRLAATPPVRPARHAPHGPRDRSLRQFRADRLRPRFGARLAAPRHALPAGRRVGWRTASA
jgi:hypothetical protein